MRRAPRISLAPEEERILEKWAAERSGAGRLARRSRIVLGAARGRTNAEIAAELATSPETVARWRTRFVVNGLEGVEREAPRSGDARRVPNELVDRILDAGLDAAGTSTGRWSTRALARSLRVNHMLVHRVWKARGRPDSPIVAPGGDRAGLPVVDVAGAIVTPAVRAVVFSVRSGGPGAPEAPRPEEPDIRADALAGFSPDAAASVVGSVRRLERVPRRSLRTGGSTEPLLVFLRGLERDASAPVRFEVVTDRRERALDPRTVAWVRAHRRFRLLGRVAAERWSATVGRWLAAWQERPIDGESFRAAAAFARAFAPPGPDRRRALARYSWRSAAG